MKLALVFLLLFAAAWLPLRQGVDDAPRFRTTRESAIELELPAEDDAFTFAVYGDRTGGPASGVAILAQAVEETNLLGPDLVMTVGDLIEGYNRKPEWLVQAAQYQAIMDGLDAPWFPVVGNHDVYGPGGGAPYHDADYEEHFGPLWYAFRHKDCWFVALHSDEGDPTGQKSFGRPEAQRMSDEQLAFLTDTLVAAQDARHVFVFLHHPRWLGGGYGDDWERVHSVLAEAGNVSAVFAGHIHHMRYDGARDGIEYFTLATVGGAQAGDLPEAGWLHHYVYVTVRGDELDVVSYPVGSAADPRKITGRVSDEARLLTRELRPRFAGTLELGEDLAVRAQLAFELVNPATSPIEATVALACDDPCWSIVPESAHVTLGPGETRRLDLSVAREAGPLDASFDVPELLLGGDLLATDLRVPLPERRALLPVSPRSLPRPAPPEWGEGSVLILDGSGDCLAIPSRDVPLADGPFTVECRVRADTADGSQGLVAKTESSEYGLFLQEGRPAFYVHLGSDYAIAEAGDARVEPGTWHHVVGQFDGAAVEVFLDGVRVARTEASGTRTRNDLPLLVGADVLGGGDGGAFLLGCIDDVRLSDVARYPSAPFKTSGRDREPDEHTLLLLNMNGAVGPWAFDDSPAGAHATLRGDARIGVE